MTCLRLQVFLDANKYHWGPKTTFNSGSCGVRKAARDNRGWQAMREVDAAFASVGVRCSE